MQRKAYTLANVKELLPDLDPAMLCKSESERLIGFLGTQSPYSNFPPSVFKVNGETIYKSEQFIQVDKAASGNDDITRAKIRIKKTYMKLKCMIVMWKVSFHKKWEWDRARNVAYTALVSKLGHDEGLKNRLI